MDQTLTPLRGMVDVLPPQSYPFSHVIDQARKTLGSHGYQWVDPPLLERPELFMRAIGSHTDVVNKEMYTFHDRSHNSVTLRPELTVGVMRLLLNSSLRQQWPQRFFYHGAAFRYERPQKGRQRQFNQVGIELLGASNLLSDVDVIVTAHNLLVDLGIADHVELSIHTIGHAGERLKYSEDLKRYFIKNYESLSAHAQQRVTTNPLRVLDSKSSQDQEIIAQAPVLMEYLSKESIDRLDATRALLDNLGISSTLDRYLVRGLDYYNNLVFEFRATQGLGAQSAVLAGGRYDGLSQTLKGPAMPAVGWAAGVERLALLVKSPPSETLWAMIAIDGNSVADIHAVQMVVARLRSHGVRVMVTTGSDTAKSTRDAVRAGCILAVFIGEDERAEGVAAVKCLQSKRSIKVAIDRLCAEPDSIAQELLNSDADSHDHGDNTNER